MDERDDAAVLPKTERKGRCLPANTHERGAVSRRAEKHERVAALAEREIVTAITHSKGMLRKRNNSEATRDQIVCQESREPRTAGSRSWSAHGTSANLVVTGPSIEYCQAEESDYLWFRYTQGHYVLFGSSIARCNIVSCQ